MLPFLPLASFNKRVNLVVERFQESAKQAAVFQKLLPCRIHISGAAEQEQPQTSNPAPPTVPHKSRALLIVLPHIKTGYKVNTLNRNLQRVKRIWGPLLILRRLRGNGPDARGLRPVKTSPSK